MLRFICACLFATLLLLSTCASCVLLPTVHSSHATVPAVQQPVTAITPDLDRERQRTLQLQTGLADRSQAEKALETLALIEELQQQEQRLWAYYQALHESARTRQSITEQRIALEELLNDQEQMQQNIDKRLRALRPTQRPSIQFNN